MRRIKIKRISRIIVFAVAVIALAALLKSLHFKTTVDAASLKHIDEIIAANKTYNVLEIVPDAAAASFGYYIDGQEPIAGWKTTLAGIKSPDGASNPAARSSYINDLFKRLADKGILGNAGTTTTPLQCSYYDDTNKSYYTESYTVQQGWNVLHLSQSESSTLTGTFTPAENGAYNAAYAYTPSPGGGYIQNIARFEYSAAPVYGEGDYYYNPVFTKLEAGADFTENWDQWKNVAIYTLDSEIYGYIGTVEQIINNGGFEASVDYYYVNEADSGQPGSFYYKAVVKTDGGDGFKAATGASYFSRSITGFTYVGTGGTYTYSNEGGSSYTVYYTDVYYRAGFINNNLFKKSVFGLDNYNLLNVTVTVKKASDLKQEDIDAASMIYISAGTDITSDGAVTAYDGANDIPDACAVQIYDFTYNQNPLIIDYSIIQGITQNTPVSSISNIQMLSLICLQSSLPLANGSTLDDLTADWSGIWTNLSYMSGDSEEDHTFVNNNVYCFNAFNTVSLSNQPNITYVVSSLFDEPFSSAVISSGFSPVLAEIVNENFLRTIAGQQTLLPENVTVSNCVRHVINYAGRRMTNPKTSITVLDLEPAKVTAATWLTTDDVRSWINATAETFPDSNIRIIHMTTGEFIGKIEDLNETYDMVYIGMSTETMNTVNGAATVYNDSNMNGLIYTNIGDKYYSKIELAGIRTQDYVNVNGTLAINGSSGTNANLFRFSGNDITKTAATALQKFAMAGYPIILDDGFISGTGINTATVDNSSYMYKAVTAIYGKYANAMKQTDAVANTSLVIKYLNVSKPQIVFSEDNAGNPIKPIEYVGDTSPSLPRNTNGTDDTSDDYYELNYDFKIDNVTDPTPVSTTYDCRLFVDLNADGRYSDEEELNDIAVYRDSDGALILPISSSGGEYYALSANVKYSVKRHMPGTYVGIIPWKLEVIKNGADQIHASQQGYTHIAADSSNITTINVLQIMQTGTENTKLNLHTQMSDPQGIYGKLIRGLKDFAVNIDMVTTDALETKGQMADEIKDWLETKGLTGQKGYDMLIIGFNDCYDGIKTNSAGAIVGYINDGKSVLFTHDTTSLTQVPPGTQLAKLLTTKVVNPADVFWFTSGNVKSADGKINWYSAAYDTVSPPNIRQSDPTYVVFMSSNVSSTMESVYYNAYVRGNIYKVTGSSYTPISNPKSYYSFKKTTGSAPVIYVYCSSASGWYGINGYTEYFDLMPKCNFTKFINTSKYTCTGMNFEYANLYQGGKPSSDYTNLSNTQYDQIMKCLYNTNVPYYLNGSTKYNYTVLGKYDPASNTYDINNATWWPPAGSAFPPEVLYDGNPAYTNTLTAFPNSITDWGYYFNTVIRDFVGLDRYGVTNPAYRSTVEAMPAMTEGLLPTISLVQDTYQRSVALAPKSGGSSVVNEFQGYTNYALIRFAESGNSNNYMKNTYSNRETTYVSQVNKGQITTYPYNVNTLSFGGNDSSITKTGGSYMQIGKTHEQYFQINMNTDDIVVWYCMSNYSGYNAYTGVVTYDDSSYYDDVPNDCVNAYYIYNKGNVTYSGVGHTSNASLYTGTAIGQQYINEAKLFVNTMIAAYRSSEQKTNVEIKKDSYGTTNISQKFMMADEGVANDANDTIILQQSSGLTDESRAVYFRISDPNVGEKTITAQYYVADPSGPLDKDIGANVIELTTTGQDGNPKPLDTYNSDNELAELKGGFVYKFYLPDVNCLDRLKNDNVNSIKIYVKITTTLGSGAKPIVSSAFINIYKQQMFMLS